MLFNSIEFAIFLPIVFILYWYVFGKSSKSQNAFLLFASYVFYAFADYRFLALLLFTTLCTYYSALAINKHKNHGEQKKAKTMSALNIVANLLVLGFFKYYNFFVSSFAAILPGVNTDCLMLNIVLPLGISYYTFSALSYSIDVYRGNTKAIKDFVQLALYIGFFPQIVSGPIGRSTYLLPQYAEHRVFQYKNGANGLRQLLWGLFKKVVIADHCAVYLLNISYQNQPGSTIILAIIFGTFQIYADFSGYSDMAIGIARLFGINLIKNFDNPFFSHNIVEFWSKWHISLTSWLRDYIYKPLMGWTKFSIIRNILIVFIICGLWHGANWNYVLWGLYNAILIAIYVFTNQWQKKTKKNHPGHILLTFTLICFGFSILGIEQSEQAQICFQKICSWETLSFLKTLFFDFSTLKRTIAIIFMLVVEWIHRNEEYPFTLNIVKNHCARLCIYYILCMVIILSNIEGQPFIYAQF